MVVVTLMVLSPGKQVPDTGNLLAFDKIAHFTFFAGESVLLLVGITKYAGNRRTTGWVLLLSTGLTMVHNILLETGQALIPGRTVEWMDMLANFLGIVFGVAIFYIIYKFNI